MGHQKKFQSFPTILGRGPSILNFGKKTQGKSAIFDLFYKIFCFGHHFLTDTFCQFFSETPTLTIFMLISTNTRMAVMTILLKLAIVAWRNMAINMINMGVTAKNWQNINSLRRWIEKITSVKKLWPKQNIFYVCPKLKMDGSQPRMVEKLWFLWVTPKVYICTWWPWAL